MIHQFRAKLAPASKEGEAVALVMPWGAVVEHDGQKVTFDQDSISIPERTVAVNIDHGDGALERIGKLTDARSTDAGLEAVLALSDTSSGRDVRTLLRDGVLEDVSAGVAISSEREIDGVLHKAGELDHVAIVARGAFGEAGSKVLAVHKEDPMKDEKQVETPPEPAVTEDFATAAEVLELRQSLATIEGDLAGVRVEEKHPLDGMTLDQFMKAKIVNEFVGAKVEIEGVTPAHLEAVQKFALADDTSTTGAGVVPDFISGEILSIVDTDRAYISEHPKDPIGSAGMSVDYPTWATKPSVDVQATEKTEVDSTASAVTITSFDLETIAGATDVSLQLIRRSSPSFVTQLFREYAHVYAVKTETLATAAAVAGAGGTAILADLGADAALTQAAYLTANSAIIAGVRRPATHNFLAPDRWEQLLSLVDSTGRPLVATTPASERFNAPGVVVGNSMVGEYLGLKVVLVPDAATGTCLIENVDRGLAILEQKQPDLSAVQVDLLGVNMGVWSLFSDAVKYADGLYTLTLV